MSKLIRDLAITGGIYDCITDPYDKLKNGDPYSSVMPDLERFAKKVINEAYDYILFETLNDEPFPDRQQVLDHFGIQHERTN